MRFPNESDAYRAARNELLDAEIELRRSVEAVAAKRRALPLGGEIAEDYAFRERDGDVRLSELFDDGKDSLIVYNFMYGPAMAAPCVCCTSMLDALDGEAPHVVQRVNLVVVAKSPIDRIHAAAEARGWRSLRLLSSADSTYNLDYGGENAGGGQMPALNVFGRRAGRVHHFYGAELLFVAGDPGQDPRHADLIWPLWNLFDLTPEGRGTNWYPSLQYE
jgi:predicted dithiol-disulfide oxidoreductase (DUF899 family)